MDLGITNYYYYYLNSFLCFFLSPAPPPFRFPSIYIYMRTYHYHLCPWFVVITILDDFHVGTHGLYRRLGLSSQSRRCQSVRLMRYGVMSSWVFMLPVDDNDEEKRVRGVKSSLQEKT